MYFVDDGCSVNASGVQRRDSIDSLLSDEEERLEDADKQNNQGQDETTPQQKDAAAKSGLCCHLCGISFGQRVAGLKSHYALGHFKESLRRQYTVGMDKESLYCAICGSGVFSSELMLLKHIGGRHNRVRDYLPQHIWERVESFSRAEGGSS
jgi:hypothetical protein